MNRDLEQAIERLGHRPEDFPTHIETGGCSDDCHGVGAAGPGISPSFAKDLGNEYREKAVEICLPDGSVVVFTTTYGDREWTTYIALPPGCSVRGTTLQASDLKDEDE